MSTADENVDVVRALYAAFTARNVGRVVRYIHPEGEFRPAGTSLASGRTEPYRGVDGMRQYFADVASIWDVLVIEPQDYRASGDSVIVSGHVRGRGAGIETDTDVAWLWTIQDRQVISCRVFPTSGEALRWLDDDPAGRAPEPV